MDEIIHSGSVPRLLGEQVDIVKYHLTSLCGQHLFIYSGLE